MAHDRSELQILSSWIPIVEVLLTWCTSTDTLSVVALLEETVDTTDGELETRLRGARLGLGGGITGGLARLGLAAALARHFDVFVELGEVVGVESKDVASRTRAEIEDGERGRGRAYIAGGDL